MTTRSVRDAKRSWTSSWEFACGSRLSSLASCDTKENKKSLSLFPRYMLNSCSIFRSHLPPKPEFTGNTKELRKSWVEQGQAVELVHQLKEFFETPSVRPWSQRVLSEIERPPLLHLWVWDVDFARGHQICGGMSDAWRLLTNLR